MHRPPPIFHGPDTAMISPAHYDPIYELSSFHTLLP